MRDEPQYDRHVAVDSDQFDAALVLTLRDPSTGETKGEVRIAVEDIPYFADQVTHHAMQSLSTAAKRLEVGHCETCGNSRLVTAPAPGGGGRTWKVQCPDCSDRVPRDAFKNAPHIGRLEG